MRMNKATVMMAMVAGAAWGGVHARADDGCSVYRIGIPDLDQVRRASGMIAGLPNDGRMFCAPTSVSNHIGYLNNLGFPNLCLGAKDWQNHYAAGTAYINLTNFYCDVDPFDGGSMMPGARERIEAYYPDDFTVASYYGNGVGPTPQIMYSLMSGGCLVTFCYGRYTFTPASLGFPGRWVRGGGHCVTLSAVVNGCSDSPVIGYRDPASGGDSDTTQSAFATAYWPIRQVTAYFANEVNVSPGAPKSFHILDKAFDDGRLRVIDGACIIWPIEGLSVDATQGILSAQKFADLNLGITGGANPTHTVLLLPAVQRVRESAARVQRHPALPLAVVTLDGDTTGPAQPGLWRCDLGTREWLRIGPVPQGGGCFGPDGRYFFGVAGGIRGINSEAPEQPTLEMPVSGHTVLALGTSDPATDGDPRNYQLISVSRFNGGVFVAAGDVDGDGCGPINPQPLPRDVVIPGGCEIGVSPFDGSFLLAREGFANILRCGKNANGGWIVLETIVPPGCPQPKGPHFDNRGRIIYCCDGTVNVLERDAANGQWRPKTDSRWHGRHGGDAFELGRGRDGLSGWANTPLDVNLDPETEMRQTQGHTVPDCAADFNNDGFVDFFDFADFVHCFEGDLAACPAHNPPQVVLDMNADGFIDFFDFDAFVEAFERGC